MNPVLHQNRAKAFSTCRTVNLYHLKHSKKKTQTQNPSSEEIPQKYQRLKPVAFLQQVQVIDAGYTAIFGLELAVRLLASGVGFFYRTLAIEDVEVFDESYC